jgi:H+-translocating NAD(P) transhydrogenase subunit alpha
VPLAALRIMQRAIAQIASTEGVPLKIVVLKETRPNERRVAMVPAVADKLTKLGAELHMQAGAGEAVKLADSAFKNVTFSSDLTALVRDADVVLTVQPPEVSTVDAMKEGAILVSFIYAHKEPELTRRLRDKRITCFAMELVPRITRA